jgi:uracil-DNA glycosylase
MQTNLPGGWMDAVGPELEKPYFKALRAFVAKARTQAPDEILPPDADVFAAFAATPLAKVNVLLLGQDPYPGKGLAHGLCFSVRPGVKPPASLRNIFKELHADLGCTIPNNGFLLPWARQGILMLNTVLTVQAGAAASHAGHGWETFTDAVIAKVAAGPRPVVFVLWGKAAQRKKALIADPRHTIIEGAHPSPLSARKFFGSKPFSAINRAVKAHGAPAIDWQIPDISA